MHVSQLQSGQITKGENSGNVDIGFPAFLIISRVERGEEGEPSQIRGHSGTVGWFLN